MNSRWNKDVGNSWNQGLESFTYELQRLESIFSQNHCLEEINDMLITLIPKVKDASKLGDLSL